MDTVTIPKPINGHGHPRQGEIFEHLIKLMMYIFSHYLGMGNTKPPILTAADALRYKKAAEKIAAAENTEEEFELHPVIKLREDSTPEMVREAIKCGFRFFKLYPFNMTTHSDDGIINYMCKNLRECYEVIASQRTDDGKKAHTMWHMEHPRKCHDDSEREYMGLGIFEQVYHLVPGLNMTWCHLTDSRVVPTLMSMDDRVVFELAIHYAFIRENDTHGHNHLVSRPPAKLQRDLVEIRRLMVSGHHKVINGLDDAIWPIGMKECADSMCGIWNLITGMSAIIEVFEIEKALGTYGSKEYQNLVNFTSGNAARHYELPAPKTKSIFVREPWKIGNVMTLGSDKAVPFRAGQTSLWAPLLPHT